MEPDDVRDKIREIFCEQMGYTEEQLKDDANLTDDLGADSLDCVELAMELEDAFDINIPDAKAQKFSNKSVGEVIDAIQKEIGV